MESFNANRTQILNSFANGDGSEVIGEDLNITEGGPVITGTIGGDFSVNEGHNVVVEEAISAMNANNSSAPVYSTPQYSPTSPAANAEYTPRVTPESRAPVYNFFSDHNNVCRTSAMNYQDRNREIKRSCPTFSIRSNNVSKSLDNFSTLHNF